MEIWRWWEVMLYCSGMKLFCLPTEQVHHQKTVTQAPPPLPVPMKVSQPQPGGLCLRTEQESSFLSPVSFLPSHLKLRAKVLISVSCDGGK